MSVNVDAFIADELSSGHLVTYLLLSRKCAIDVNAAKNELERYHRENETSAMYLVSGQPSTSSAIGQGTAPEEDVLATKMTLVKESALDETKSQFAKLNSCHVYSLSLSPELDYAVFRDATNAIRACRPGHASPKRKPVQPAASSSKIPLTEAKPQTKPAEVEKPKTAGKLDWSKAKVKKEPSKQQDSLVPKLENLKDDVRDERRGTKRKSDVKAESAQKESKAAEPEPSAPARIKKGVVLSDDEEDVKAVKSRFRKRPDADMEIDIEANAARALMDIDDSEVVRVSRTASVNNESLSNDTSDDKNETTQSESEDIKVDEDAAMDEDSDPAPKVKPRKRKEKKVIPVGRNGLKKRRVVKSRMSTDAKGYMVTEDYSSYESVDEEEEEPEQKPKPTIKSKSAASKEKITSAPKESKLKRTSTGGSQQNMMKSFFGGGGTAKK